MSNTSYPALALMIDGERVTGGGRSTHAVRNPATGETLAELPLATKDDLDRALATAQRGFQRWRKAPAEERAGVLRKAAQLIRERQDELARLATMEQGKPLAEAKGEAGAVANLFDFYAGEVQRVYGRILVRPEGRRSTVIKLPVGPVAAFAPWNFPLVNPGRKLVGPIAAGCSVIVKPAEETPASALAILQILYDAGLPTDVAQVVFGEPDMVSRHLLGSPIIRKLSFTGSTPVGKHLMKLAADNMQRTTMELGGHGPVLVFDDADIEAAAAMTAAGKFRNAGQVCVSPTRFYVQEDAVSRFVEAFTEKAKAVKVGDGLESGTGMGPMANPRRPDAMEAMIGDARSQGAKLHTGGERIGNRGFFYEPTVLSHVPLEAQIMNNEPFGPVALVNPFRTYEDAIEAANRLPYGLAAYAFTRNTRRQMDLSRDVEAGMIGINNLLVAHADAPFGGVKESGHGHEDGPEGLDACLVTKAIHEVHDI